MAISRRQAARPPVPAGAGGLEARPRGRLGTGESCKALCSLGFTGAGD